MTGQQIKFFPERFKLRNEFNDACKAGLVKNFKLGNMKARRSEYIEWLEDQFISARMEIERLKNKDVSINETWNIIDKHDIGRI